MTIAPPESPIRGAGRSSSAYDFAAAFVGIFVICGVYLDGWAHNHHKVDQSFFTPWHAALYLSITLAGAFFFATYARNRMRGAHRRDALPPGYLLSFAGVALFFIGGIADLVWHSFFGIEQDTAALLSPTHLVLALAGALIVSGPWRAALNALPRGSSLSWRNGLPLVLSVASIIALIGFMTEFTHPLTATLASTENQSGGSAFDVYVMNADGSGQTRLTMTPKVWEGFPAWSPDGRRLVLAVSPSSSPGDLYVMNADGSDSTELTHTPGTDFSPSWSPDGGRIAFISNVGPNSSPSQSDLFVINADGSDTRQLAPMPGRAWGTSWSPDSKRIAFTSMTNGVWQIYVVNADGSNVRQITNERRNSVGPAWSRDGTTIAFHREVRGNRSRINLMDPDGSNIRVLPGTGQDYDATWAPGGDKLAFTSFRGSRGELLVTDLQGRETKNLSQGAGQGFDFAAWSPDGSRIAYSAWTTGSGQDREVTRRLGVSSILLQTIFLVAPLLLVLRPWSLPFGSIALVLLLTSLGAAVLKDHYDLIPGAVLAGLAADLVLLRARSALRLHLFATVLPAAFYGCYFATLTLTDGIDWSIHLWAGSIAMAAIAGLGLSYLAETTAPEAGFTSVADAP